MHIKSLSVERYKAFFDKCTIELRPLTILVGANNAGKSALARSIPLFAGGLLGEASPSSVSPLPLDSSGVDHGKNFEDLISGRAQHGQLGLSAAFVRKTQQVNLECAIQNIVMSPGRSATQAVSKWKLTVDDDYHLELSRENLKSNKYNITENSNRGTPTSCELIWRGILPDLRTIAVVDNRTLEIVQELGVWARSLRYLRSPRELIDSPFMTPLTPPTSIGVSGSDTPKLLARSDDLLNEVRQWYRKIFDVRFDIRQQGDTSVAEIQGESSRSAVALSQTGQGLSQVLPVAAFCMTARSNGPGVDIVEHPELELHPRAHADVADLLVSNLAGEQRPLVVETHSEILLLRIRRHVVEGRLNPDDVAIYWIDRHEESEGATIRTVRILPSGEVDNWPDGVFQESYEEIVAIRRANRDRAE